MRRAAHRDGRSGGAVGVEVADDDDAAVVANRLVEQLARAIDSAERRRQQRGQPMFDARGIHDAARRIYAAQHGMNAVRPRARVRRERTAFDANASSCRIFDRTPHAPRVRRLVDAARAVGADDAQRRHVTPLQRGIEIRQMHVDALRIARAAEIEQDRIGAIGRILGVPAGVDVRQPWPAARARRPDRRRKSRASAACAPNPATHPRPRTRRCSPATSPRCARDALSGWLCRITCASLSRCRHCRSLSPLGRWRAMSSPSTADGGENTGSRDCFRTTQLPASRGRNFQRKSRIAEQQLERFREFDAFLAPSGQDCRSASMRTVTASAMTKAGSALIHTASAASDQTRLRVSAACGKWMPVNSKHSRSAASRPGFASG